jgi:hypothetical protein
VTSTQVTLIRSITWAEYKEALALHEQSIFGATSVGYCEGLPESPRSHSTEFALILGIFSGGRLVGWHYSHEDAGEVLMRDTGILPEHQSKGVYTKLLPILIGHFVSCGFSRIRSRHIATNRAAITPKFRYGFVVAGHESEGETQYVKLAYDASIASHAQSSDPTLASVTSRAAHEPRLP